MRTTFLGLLCLAFAGPALATSELQLGSNMPVVLYLDGESVGTVQPHEPLLLDIDSGVHNVRIQGVLGKDLYDRDLIFDDDTRTELVWQRKQLRLGQVVKLDPNRPPTAEEDHDELPVVPEHPTAPEPPEASAPAKVASAPPPPPAKMPAPPSPRRTAKAKPPKMEKPAPPIAVPVEEPVAHAAIAPPVRDVRGPAPVPAEKSPGSVVIEAKEGMDLQIAHGTQLLRVTVENGELVVIDGNGTEIHFPNKAEAW